MAKETLLSACVLIYTKHLARLVQLAELKGLVGLKHVFMVLSMYIAELNLHIQLAYILLHSYALCNDCALAATKKDGDIKDDGGQKSS